MVRVNTVVISLNVGRFVASGVLGKLDSFCVRRLSSTFSFGDLDMVVRQSAAALRGWCDLDSDRWPSRLGLTALSAFEIFDQQ